MSFLSPQERDLFCTLVLIERTKITLNALQIGVTHLLSQRGDVHPLTQAVGCVCRAPAVQPPVIRIHARSLRDSLRHDEQLVIGRAVPGREDQIAAGLRLQLAKLVHKLRRDVHVPALVCLGHEVVLRVLVNADDPPVELQAVECEEDKLDSLGREKLQCWNSFRVSTIRSYLVVARIELPSAATCTG